MKVTRELIEELRRLHAESLSQSAVVAEDKLLLHIGALLDHIERQDEALRNVTRAWLHEASQGDGIMEEHGPVLDAARAAMLPEGET